ncbi:MAG TPA: tetratricopeptide repeat protein [Desulfobacterales bacterium]|nr:MAG: hypothetical protein DRI57_26555 [Deltaproteobacteria bacterium]HHC24237.1 tetratricopeptide repeat protein [Desulfobacterales bacterium]
MFKKNIIFGIICMGLIFLAGCSVLTKANVKLSQKQYEDAILLYEKYLEKHPETAEARSGLGIAYFKIGFLDEAIAAFEAVPETKPGEPDATLYKGLAYLKKGETDRAIKVLQGYRNSEQPLIEEEVGLQLKLFTKKMGEDPVTYKKSLSALADQFEAYVNEAALRQKKVDERTRGLSEKDTDGGTDDGGGCGCE